MIYRFAVILQHKTVRPPQVRWAHQYGPGPVAPVDRGGPPGTGPDRFFFDPPPTGHRTGPGFETGFLLFQFRREIRIVWFKTREVGKSFRRDLHILWFKRRELGKSF